MSTDDVLVRVDHLSKRFCRSLRKSLWYGLQDLGSELLGRRHSEQDSLRDDEFWAIKDVSFQLRRGECLGLVGRNGAGKTTVLRLLNGLIRPDQGRIELRGSVAALIALGAGFNPVLTGRENIYVNAAVLGMNKREVEDKMDEIIDFSEIGDFIDSPVQNYSSGMQVRLGFSIASTLSPDILILDEVLAVGDADFQAKCLRRLGSILNQSAVILVSHFPHHIKKLCNQAILLERGSVAMAGSAESILEAYQERQSGAIPETLLLLGSGVLDARVETITRSLLFGEFLEFEVHLNLSQPTRCDQSYINLVDAGDAVHAQVVLKDFEGVLPAGESSHRVRIGPLHLSTGRYSGNFVLYGDGGKSTIVHCRRCLDFAFRGPPNLGPVYYPPSQIFRL